jgi:LPS-assembly protein
MSVRTSFFITALLLCHLQLHAQTLTSQLPSASQLPDAPQYPTAEVVPQPPTGVPVRFESKQQEKHGNVYLLTGDVRIDYKDFTLRADTVSYDESTKDAEADGHVRLEGKLNNELILADHGKFNFELESGRFENVTGSIGRKPSAINRRMLYDSGNPFLFTARELIKEGPERYRLVHGSMTSCLLPDPDWSIHSELIRVDYGEARANNSFFTLLGKPILYLPYVTHPVDTESRESGLLIPTFSNSSQKGLVLGEQFYWSINRSADLTLGTQYFSKRGWSPNGELRYRGRGEDFAAGHFIALFDRGLQPGNINQGGQDIVLSGRRDFDLNEDNRAVVTGEYLSSYIYRVAFAESFAQAVASEVTSSAYLTHNVNNLSASLDFDRYQNFEGITQVGNTYDSPQIRIAHIPAIDIDTLDSRFQGTPVHWRFDGSASGLNRSEPGFQSGNVGRFDLYPHLSLPLHFDGWTLLPEVGARETFYTQDQIPTSTTPSVGNSTVNRSDLEASFELRPPVLVRDFQVPALENLFGSQMRHTVESELHYRYVAGVNNFSSIPRFDATDIESDTNELEYSITQRLYFKHLHPKPCSSGDLPPPLNGNIYVPGAYRECGGDTDAWLTWKLAAKYFFDPYFGGAASPLRRNVLTSTLDFTGVAFLNGPRNTSPVISRLQIRTSEHADLEWDADYDFKTKRLDASNIYLNYRRDNFFGSVAHSTLDALNPTFTTELGTQVTKYNLLRLLFGYGDPTRPGFSVNAQAGYDFVQNALQYGQIQTSYNWNCCGLSIEYRRLALGSVRNENECCTVRFTLAGIGAAGNQYFRYADRIF